MTLDDPRGSTPIPDPTLLTTQQLLRELGLLKEIIDTRLAGIEQIMEEKFISVDRRFESSTLAVDTALRAAKESVSQQNQSFETAIDKAEKATQKQLDAIVGTAQTERDSLRNSLNDLKERFNRVEGAALGTKEQKTEQTTSASLAFSAAGIVIAIFGVGAGVIIAIAR